jgi:hypothetical protein
MIVSPAGGTIVAVVAEISFHATRLLRGSRTQFNRCEEIR